MSKIIKFFEEPSKDLDVLDIKPNPKENPIPEKKENEIPVKNKKRSIWIDRGEDDKQEEDEWIPPARNKMTRKEMKDCLWHLQCINHIIKIRNNEWDEISSRMLNYLRSQSYIPYEDGDIENEYANI